MIKGEDFQKVEMEIDYIIHDYKYKMTDDSIEAVKPIFDKVKKVLSRYEIPVNPKVIDEIVDENKNETYDTISERMASIKQKIGQEIEEQIEKNDPELNKNMIEKKPLENTEEEWNRDVTVEDTRRVLENLRNDVEKIKDEAINVARQNGFKENDIEVISKAIDNEVANIDVDPGNLIYNRLSEYRDQIMEKATETCEKYKTNIKENTEEQETGRKKFEDMLKDGDIPSYKEQAENAESFIKKQEDEKENPTKPVALRDDILE